MDALDLFHLHVQLWANLHVFRSQTRNSKLAKPFLTLSRYTKLKTNTLTPLEHVAAGWPHEAATASWKKWRSTPSPTGNARCAASYLQLCDGGNVRQHGHQKSKVATGSQHGKCWPILPRKKRQKNRLECFPIPSDLNSTTLAPWILYVL